MGSRRVTDPTAPPPLSGDVETIFAAYPDAVRATLLDLRAMIYAVAAGDPRIGRLTETLKWNEPAYLTGETGAGTTIRLNAHAKSATRCGLYVNCRTDLAQRYRSLYSNLLQVEGERALLFDVGADPPRDAVRHCIAMALTYHLR